MIGASRSVVWLESEFERLAAAELGEAELLTAVADRVAHVIPCDGCCVSRADPDSLVLTHTRFTGIPAEEFVDAFYESESEPQEFARHRDLVGAHGRAAVLAALTDGQPYRSRRYRRLLRPMGVEHELRAAAVAGDAAWGFLHLYRRPGRRGFDADELTNVRRSLSSLANALRAPAARRAAPSPGSRERRASVRGPVTLLLDRSLDIVASAGPAHEWLDAMRDPTRVEPTLPVGLISVVFGALLGEPQTQVPVQAPAGTWWLLSASMLDAMEGADTVAVTIEPGCGAPLARLLMLAVGLTPAERSVCEWVLAGASTNLIAASLHISAYTVQDRLKAIFAKAQVGSRGELVARLLTV